MNETDLNTIYEDSYGQALDIFGRYYLNTDGRPLGLHELIESLDSPMVNRKPLHPIAGEMNAVLPMTNNSNL